MRRRDYPARSEVRSSIREDHFGPAELLDVRPHFDIAVLERVEDLGVHHRVGLKDRVIRPGKPEAPHIAIEESQEPLEDSREWMISPSKRPGNVGTNGRHSHPTALIRPAYLRSVPSAKRTIQRPESPDLAASIETPNLK